MDYNIYIPKAIYGDPSYTDYEVLVYSGIQQYIPTKFGDTFALSANILAYTMYGPNNYSEKTCRELGTALNRLIDDGILQGERAARDYYLIREFQMKDSAYARISYESLRTILSLDFSRKASLWRYLCFVIGSLNNRIKIEKRSNIIGNQSILFFADAMDMSPNTIMRYNECLEAAHILYIAHGGMQKSNGGRWSNIYGRYEDRELIIAYCNGRDVTHNQMTANSLRAVSQKYNQYCKVGGAGYTEEEVLALYRMCQSYNERMDELQRTQPGDDYTRRKKDLSVFRLDIYEDDDL